MFGGSSTPDNRPPEYVRNLGAYMLQRQHDNNFTDWWRDQWNTDGGFGDPRKQEGLDGATDYWRGQGTEMVTGALNDYMGFMRGEGTLDDTVRGFANNVMDGRYTNPAMEQAQQWADPNNINPYLDQISDRASRQTTDQYQDALTSIRGNAALSGARGSTGLANAVGDADQALARGLADANANIYGQGYENASNRAMQANQMAGNMFQQDFGNMFQAGAILDQGTTRQMNAVSGAPQMAQGGAMPYQSMLGLGDYATDQQWLPYERGMNLYSQAAGTSAGWNANQGGGGPGALGGAVGGAATGAAIGSMFGPGYGTLIGAGIGAIGGGLMGHSQQ